MALVQLVELLEIALELGLVGGVAGEPGQAGSRRVLVLLAAGRHALLDLPAAPLQGLLPFPRGSALLGLRARRARQVLDLRDVELLELVAAGLAAVVNTAHRFAVRSALEVAQ